MTYKQQYAIGKLTSWIAVISTVILFFFVAYTNICSYEFVVGSLSSILIILTVNFIRSLHLKQKMAEEKKLINNINNIGLK